MTHGSLFSGVGGFDLAAEWMGWQNIFHCEINPFGQQILKYYWPHAISYNNIKNTDFNCHRGGGASISSQVDSHVSLTALRESEKEKKMNATYGQKCLEQLKKSNLVGSWAKTFMGLLIGMEGWYSTRCNLTWKMKGTSYNRYYCQLQASTLHTKDTGSGLLPTPAARDEKNGSKLEDGRTKRKLAQKWSFGLNDLATMELLPTPMASDCGEKVTGLENQDPLVKMARQMTGKTSQLNPRFVMEMMGFPPDWTLIPFLLENQSDDQYLKNGETNPSKVEVTQ